MNRFTELETQLDTVKTDFGHRLNTFESRLAETVKGHMETSQLTMETMKSTFENLKNVVATLVNKGDVSVDTNMTTAESSVAAAPESVQAMNIVDKTTDPDPLNLKMSRENMVGTESSATFESLDQKHLRSSQKRLLLCESICRRLDPSLEDVQTSPQQAPATCIKKLVVL